MQPLAKKLSNDEWFYAVYILMRIYRILLPPMVAVYHCIAVSTLYTKFHTARIYDVYT
jgi:hypothetical protein